MFEKVTTLFTSYSDLSKRRLNQLEREELMDVQIRNSMKDCPRTVILFMLHYRKLNRELSKNTYEASLLDTPEKAVLSVEKTEDILNRFENEQVSTCKKLRNLLRHLKTVS